MKSSCQHFKLPLGVLLLLCTIFSFMSGDAFSQERKKYKGSYTLKGLEGEANYDYLQFKNDSTLKEGPFEYIYRKADSLKPTQFNRIEANGRFTQGKKNGRWKYNSAIHEITINDVVAYSLKTSLRSSTNELVAFYNKNGVPNGNWEYRLSAYADEKLTDLAATESMPFENGLLHGFFAFRTSNADAWGGLLSIEGSCDHGLLDSLWTFTYMRDTLLINEHRYYDKGFLTRVVKSRDTNGDTLVDIIFDSTISKLAVLRNTGSAVFRESSRTFGPNYVDNFDIHDRKALTQVQANDYLRKITSEVTGYDPAYFKDGKGYNLPFGTKRFEFIQIPADDSMRAQIKENYAYLLSKIKELSQWNTFELNKKRTDSLYYASEKLKWVNKRLDRLQYILDKTISDDYPYFDAFSYMNREDFKFMNPDTLHYTFEEEEHYIHRNYNARLDKNTPLLKRLYEYTTIIKNEVEELHNVVKSELNQLQIGDKLEKIQQELLALRNSLESQLLNREFASDADEELSRNVATNFLGKNYDEFISSYGKSEHEDGRIEEANDYMRVLQKVENCIRPLSLSFVNQEKLRNAYTEKIFDAFTYSTYERPLKEDLFKAGSRLFNHYVRMAGETQNAAELSDYLQKIEKLQKLLEKLRFEETRSLERALRGKTDAKEIESILGINGTGK